MITVVRSLLGRLGEGHADVTTADTLAWPDGVLVALEARGLLVRGETASGLVCDQCERACWLEPRLARPPGREPVLLHACVEEAGTLLKFSPDRLHTWRVDAATLSRLVRERLALVGELRERVPGRLWELGEWRRDRGRRTLYHAVGLGEHEATDLLEEHVTGLGAAVLWTGPAADVDVPMLSLAEVVLVDHGEIDLDIERIAHWLGRDKRSRSKPVEPFAVPPDAAWERLIVVLLDDERVELRYGKRSEIRTFIEMGMVDGRSISTNPRPDRAWGLLKLFAQEGGQIRWGDAAANDDVRDRVRGLREKLAAVVPINGSPIRDYSTEHGYRAAFTVRRAP